MLDESTAKGGMGTGAKIAIVAILAAAVVAVVAIKSREGSKSNGEQNGATLEPGSEKLPKLLDLGAGKCIPCKMMAPILDELRETYKGKIEVEFIDVWKNPGAGKKYGIRVIPTQIFYDAKGKELFRHEGFFSREDILGKWKELGVDLGGGGPGVSLPAIVREEPLAAADNRPKDSVCFMCERTIGPKIRVTVAPKSGGSKYLCSPHCYFIFESCLLDKSSVVGVKVTDWATGKRVALDSAFYLHGADKRGRPMIKAFVSRGAAEAEMRTSGGSIMSLGQLKEKEYSVRCGFCDRAMYLQDNGSVVRVSGGAKTYGCCPHCALGVAARLQKDIVVEYHDPISGKIIRIETKDGRVKSIEPSTAVAWFGQKQKPNGKWGSAGCFHQWNFVSVDNLKQWLKDHPTETGREITIQKALAGKMALTAEQIKGACKIGECK